MGLVFSEDFKHLSDSDGLPVNPSVAAAGLALVAALKARITERAQYIALSEADAQTVLTSTSQLRVMQQLTNDIETACVQVIQGGKPAENEPSPV